MIKHITCEVVKGEGCWSRMRKELTFGTSGLRDLVENMTDMECYINTRGFLAYLAGIGEFGSGDKVVVGCDRRASSPGIKEAVSRAVRDMAGHADDQGLIASPALVLYAMRRGEPGIMVTGSHIPDDRNGIKFTKRSGEVLKSDEAGILASVADERKKVYSVPPEKSIFDDSGMFKAAAPGAGKEKTPGMPQKKMSVAFTEYIERYTEVFGASALKGVRVFLYQHSAVARDAVKDIFERLGACVIAPDEDVEIKYADGAGEERKEKVSLRSASFVPVDTESVSAATIAVFKKMMDDHGLDIGITLDGDSDRPLLVYRADKDGATVGDVRYVTGDILGLLAVLALEGFGVRIDAVSVPVSANDAVIRVLGDKGVELTQTKIGSPYVIAAMNESRRRHAAGWNVFSWESNGGFLAGADISIDGKTLKALPTRDAVLPLILTIKSARDKNTTISGLLKKIPARFTHADRKKEFPAERSRSVIASISPEGRGDIVQLDFEPDMTAVLAAGGTEKFSEESEFYSIKKRLEGVFTRSFGFPGVKTINYVDGVKIFFTNGEISHLRPSGNAPEFRNYAVADTQERAEEIVRIGIEKIIPRLAGDSD